MLRRLLLCAALIAGTGLSAVGLSEPAGATPVTSSNITTPADGSHYRKTDTHPATDVLVKGTSNGTTGTLDVRCYYAPGVFEHGGYAPVAPDGTFTIVVSSNSFYGTCQLRAVPDTWPDTSPVTAFTGPAVTEEEIVSDTITSGPNAGHVFDYYASAVAASAFTDFTSAFSGGFNNTRFVHADGSSSQSLWISSTQFGNGASDGARSFLRVDGRDAYGPGSAVFLFATPTDHSWDNPGLPQVTYRARRDAAGNLTIHETDPIVVCPTETPLPPDHTSCPRFNRAGVRLERTIVTFDGGRQTRITDVWRSTDGKPHTISPQYQQQVAGYETYAGNASDLPVGIKLPWVSKTYKTFTGDAVLPGTAKRPATIYVRDNMDAHDGNKNFPRGALTFDYTIDSVHRVDNGRFILRAHPLKVPANGTRLVRHAFVIGTEQSAVDAAAAVNARWINPWRADGLIRTKSAKTYTGGKVYNATGRHQTVVTRAGRGTRATYYVKVRNAGTQTDTFTVKGPGSAAGFRARYYAGSTDVTGPVSAGKYKVRNLVPGAAQTLRLVIAVKGDAAVDAARSWLVTATSAHDGTRRDAVRARVRTTR